MRMRVGFIIEEGPAALKQIAACVGFANSMQIAITMEPQEDPKKKGVKWGDTEIEADEVEAMPVFKKAQAILKGGESMPRKDFTKALVKASKKTGQAIGKITARWLETGILVETD